MSLDCALGCIERKDEKPTNNSGIDTKKDGPWKMYIPSNMANFEMSRLHGIPQTCTNKRITPEDDMQSQKGIKRGNSYFKHDFPKHTFLGGTLSRNFTSTKKTSTIFQDNLKKTRTKPTG